MPAGAVTLVHSQGFTDLQIEPRPFEGPPGGEGALRDVGLTNLVHLDARAAARGGVVVEAAARVRDLLAVVLPHARAVRGHIHLEVGCPDLACAHAQHPLSRHWREQLKSACLTSQDAQADQRQAARSW